MSAASAAAGARMPRQIPYIIGNEACERFSFYGMRNILVQFLITSLLLQEATAPGREAEAKHIMHSFMVGVYFFPLLGGWLADRFFGKYTTILWFSLIYCAGHACLALFEGSREGFFVGLGLIALGAGGIKPLVASFMGDQFDQSNKHLAKLVFDAFYWIINFGSLFASLLIPLALKNLGPAWAFGIPGLLMFVATLVFWAGRRRYVREPLLPRDPHGFAQVVRSALLSRAPGQGRPGLALAAVAVVLALASFALSPMLGIVICLCLALVLLLAGIGGGTWWQLQRARAMHPDAAVDGVRAVLRVLVVFALATPFFSLFDQKASTWVLQGQQMQMPDWFSASQMQALNPALVMLLIPFNNLVLYPLLRRGGYEPTALRRMTAGIACSGLAWIVVGALQVAMDGGDALSIAWQILPYALLTFGEVLVSATGLEFAYSQAPQSMKSVVMSFWNLTTTVGNLWVLLSNAAVRNATVTAHIGSTGLSETAFLMFFFAAFACVAALLFGLYARRYRMVDHYRTA
ncbi:POT-type proton-dependent oligopeptide transporter [Xanthomonas translucens]|uniref:POT-type proton-dependent oligopeptide transporter n=2 Tax=Xanthomonas campestris pv. translucens TaxID=343 RepID=UPI0002A790A9|nr:oligopeptide:H+ symporter [Xanthomonas translucens]AKK67471.1 major facilitator transporter [Xanthomonas translucens pv. undulosa]ELQ12130.1 proton-dependent oligopeptide transporter family protein [Xanthomonas translucens DAR61454]MBC3971630.1 MFS transporter [Xanthomonas translucens pv. undulosa]MCT8270862.1 oligopeptide:H+ symporter [Xanthomonas translucens pv. undulosa]MCT8282974.1 oligopeptide:H+ symporter [Xanthomonas translucens pv. undulosa]